MSGRRAARPVRCVDTLQFGVPHRGAAYVLSSETTAAVIETGTPRAATILLDELRDVDLVCIFVTHLHLDHAGSAGALARAHPEATVVAHPRAQKHLADPSRLVAGVREASPDLFPLYGEPIPVPDAQLHAAADGERFDLGRGFTVEALHAPGHAPHHVCFHERRTGTLFCGDALGNHGIPVDVPLTVPPGFDRSAHRETLSRLRSLTPRRLAFAHYGFSNGDPLKHIDGYNEKIDAWFARIAALSRSAEDPVRAVLADPRYARLHPTDRSSIEMCVRGVLLTLASSTGP
jgi:glyoxylase-like metal-dependent hydrolase (beta-lactamase superfamily II)